MKILCIETSSNICSVALLDDTSILGQLNTNNGKTHSENLMPMVKSLLHYCNISLPEINLIACDMGPGSFTGIRIGISSVKAIAEVLQIPVVGISSLEALSYNITISSGFTISLIDARNEQVYCGIFNSHHELVQPYLADDIHKVISVLQNISQDFTFVGDGAILHKQLLQEQFPTSAFSTVNEQSAVNIGLAAYKKHQIGELGNADTLSPLYLRKSQAERMKDLNVKPSN